MSDSAPQWDLLPDSPAEFFQLTEGFTLPDLRRAYSQLIRRYKPETYPAEFQRIRGAYDSLSQQLRYGEPPARGVSRGGIDFDWGDVTGANPDQRHDDRPPDAPDQQAEVPDQPLDEEEHEPEPEPRRWQRERESRTLGNATIGPLESQDEPSAGSLTVENAKTRYDELVSREEKTPYDYYLLAVLSEIVDPQPHCFIRWLLTGLAECENDFGLIRLAQMYFARINSLGDALDCAKLAAEIVRSDSYYSLTERLWERVLREAPFPDFQRELEACEGNLIDNHAHHQMVFYLKLLRAAIWRADNDWAEEKLRLIGSLQEHLSHWTDQELHFLDQLLTYRAHRKLFVSLGALAARIDQAIEDYCTCEELEADRKFIECQHLLATRPDDLMDEFHVPDPRSFALEHVWEFIAREVIDRHGIRSVEIGPDALQRQVRGLAYLITDEGERSGYSVLSYVYIFGLLGVLLLDLGVIGVGGYRIFVELFFNVQFAGALQQLLWMLGLLVLSNAPFIIFMSLDKWLIVRYYRFLWRRHVLTFFEGGMFRVPDVVEELKRSDDQEVQDKKLEDMKEIAEVVATDKALVFYATAQRILKAIE